MSSPVLSTRALTKQYGKITAVDHLELEVPAGVICGILGPNGSGKTTTLGMVLGVTHPTAGSFQWFGQAPSASQRRRIGALLETPNFYPYLHALDNLKIVAHLRRVARPDYEEALRAVNLWDRRTDAFRTYSLGMKQRLAIAGALLGRPEVLILDEPTNGLDPRGIAEVRETIRRLGKEGQTILMASHILDEVEKTCTHVAILQKGKLKASGPVGSIISPDQVVELDAPTRESLQNWAQTLPGLRGWEVDAETQRTILYFPDPMDLSTLNQEAAAAGIALNWLSQRKRSLESEFLALVED
ncbi:MAG: ATP-binding cassette domain-containing protein [Lewinella sp.]|nr:ATP-binding cassette domain-containing protein [Lewinella sp.]